MNSRSTVGIKLFLIAFMCGLILRFVTEMAGDYYDMRDEVQSLEDKLHYSHDLLRTKDQRIEDLTRTTTHDA